MAELVIIKRADGKVYAGRNARGAAVFVEPTASDRYGKSVPMMFPKPADARFIAAQLAPKHRVLVLPLDRIYGPAEEDFAEGGVTT